MNNNNYNSYLSPNMYGNGRFYNNYNPQPQQNFNMQMQMNRQSDLPVQNIRFVNADEMKGYIVFPNTTEMLIDRDNKIVQLKSADQIGYSTVKTFRFEEIGEPSQKVSTSNENLSQIDLKDYVKKEDLTDFIKVDALTQFSRDLDEKFARLEKKISLNNIIGEK